MSKALTVEILADAKQFTAELDRAAGKTRQMGKVAGVAGLAIAGGLAVGLDESVKAAMAMETTTAKVNKAFQAAGVPISQWKDKIDEAETAGRNLGFSNIDVRESIGNLVTATQDGGKAIKDMAVAEDLARYKHITLMEATKILSSAMAGSTRAARQLGISVAAVHDSSAAASAAYSEQKKKIDALFPSTAKMTEAQKKQKDALLANAAAHYVHIKADAQLKDKQATAAQVINTVSQRLHGQAKAFSETAAGGMARFHAQIEALQENLGMVLLPALNAVISKLAEAAGWLSQHTTIAKILVIGLGALAATLMAVSVATTIAGAAAAIASVSFWALVVPIAAVIAVAAVLALAAYEIVKHWGPIKGFFVGLWGNITAIFQAALGWLESHWRIFLGLPGLVWQYWGQISHFFGRLWSGITSTFGSAISWVKGAFTGLLNWLIGQLNWLIDKVNLVAGWLTGNIGRVGTIGGSGGSSGSGPVGVGGVVGGGSQPNIHSAPLRNMPQGPNVTVNATVHGTADAAFAARLADQLATQLRGGRVPAFQQAIAAA